MRVISLTNFENYVGGFMSADEVRAVSFRAIRYFEEGEGPIKMDMSRPPFDPDSQLKMHSAPGGILHLDFGKDKQEEGLGVMPEKGEMEGTEIIRPAAEARKFRGWVKEMPFGLGIILTRWNLKLYFIRWIIGIGFVPIGVLWEREWKKQRDIST